MAFNRDRNRGGDRGGFRSRPSFNDRPRFGGRNDRGPVEMHQAICDNCGKSCEVPFRPTQGKPVYCSACFENRAGSMESRERRFEGGAPRFEERRAPERSESRPSFEQPNNNAQFEGLNSKLDKIIGLLSDSPLSTAVEEITEETVEEAKPAPVSAKGRLSSGQKKPRASKKANPEIS